MKAFTGKDSSPPEAKEGPTAEENLKGVSHKIIIMSGKGGVGKSTVAVNLAAALSARGSRSVSLTRTCTAPASPRC
jgi:ATP-binding protein involved in chromosome partitioning